MLLLIRFLHIGSALLLVGELLYSTLWLRASLASSREPAVTRYVLGTMRMTSRGLAMPLMLINIATGVIMAFMKHVVWSRSIWILLTILLYTVLGSLWHGTLIPLRKRMEAIAEQAGPGSELPVEYDVLANRWVWVSGTVLGLFAVILALMIWRPVL